MTNNWENIHKDFSKSWGESSKQKWIENGFNYKQVKNWISLGLIPREYDFAWWIISKKNRSLEFLNREEIKQLREQLKNEWSDNDISSDWNTEVQSWILEWVKKDFAFIEIKQWNDKGLSLEESSLAFYSKQNNFNNLTIEELRKEYNEKDNIDAQIWLDSNYPLIQRVNIRKLDIGSKKITGSLKLNGFSNLEELYCYFNNLTSLDCSSCPNLKIIRCQRNNLININLNNCSNLTEIYCNRNQLNNFDFLDYLNEKKIETLLLANNNFPASDLSPFSRFTNLKNLGLGNWFKKLIEQGIYNRFLGSLEHLRYLTNLEDLDIAGTDIDSGLEHLSDKIQMFHCFTKESSESKVNSIADELRKYGETDRDDDGDENFAQPLVIWKEFLDSPAQLWFDKKYSKEERKDFTFLDISKKNLSGSLKISGFINLRILICSDNQLNNLNLSDCKILKDLDCSSNKIKSLYFIKFLNSLEKLTIKNNSNIASLNLKYLSNLDILEELNINDCNLEGSLKSFENLKKLEILKINNTNLSEGLENLSLSCKKIYCNSGYECKSIKIVKELDRSRCFEEDDNGNSYYNLDSWREDKQNRIIASVVPLERLFVIRSNIKKFVNKWGIQDKSKEDDLNWYQNYCNSFDNLFNDNDKNDLTELSSLQSPEQFNKHWYWVIPQWSGRGAVGVAGFLSFFYDYNVGIITIASPVIETFTSYVKSVWYDEKENKWNEFTQDAKELLDNYHELLGTLKTIRFDGPGKLSKNISKLFITSQEFLNEYDVDKNGSIDIFELQKNKQWLSLNLNQEFKWLGGSKLERIVWLIKSLEEDINDYNQGNLVDKFSLNIEKQDLAWFIIDMLRECHSLDFDFEKEYNAKGIINWKGKECWSDYLREINEDKDIVIAKENLLCPFIELITDKLEINSLKELINNKEKNDLNLNIIFKLDILLTICKKLESDEFSDVIYSLKVIINDFSKSLSNYYVIDSEEINNSIIIELIDQDEKKLEKIINAIRKLEEEIKSCHENLIKEELIIEQGNLELLTDEYLTSQVEHLGISLHNS
ncbi:MAG: hypothetical protein AM1032_000330 [Mycoplasmataceae bacterium]|nr:MAG: hypothetical protein AM1032_000330 [Mycoplasmataceae bacterium]